MLPESIDIYCRTAQTVNVSFRGSWRIFGDGPVTIAQERRARDLTNLGYPQVPGSNLAENPSTQINIDLRKQTLKQGFQTTSSSDESQ